MGQALITLKTAVERKLKRYYTGKPCLNGHRAERYTHNSACVKCRPEQLERIKKEPTSKEDKYFDEKLKQVNKKEKKRKNNELFIQRHGKQTKRPRTEETRRVERERRERNKDAVNACQRERYAKKTQAYKMQKEAAFSAEMKALIEKREKVKLTVKESRRLSFLKNRGKYKETKKLNYLKNKDNYGPRDVEKKKQVYRKHQGNVKKANENHAAFLEEQQKLRDSESKKRYRERMKNEQPNRDQA